MEKKLCDMMKNALLFYLNLLKDMIDVRFELNPYYQCMANKVIRGNQMKIFLHVDDLKISHENPKAETKGIDYLKGVYVNMTVHHSKVHENLAIKFYFSTPGEVKV